MSGHWHTIWRVYFYECTFQFEKDLWKTGFGKNLRYSKFLLLLFYFCFNTGFYGFYGILWDSMDISQKWLQGMRAKEVGLRGPVTLP